MSYLRDALASAGVEASDDELMHAAHTIGGLIYDLKSLVEIVKNCNGSLTEAVDDMVTRCVVELRTTALGLGTISQPDWDKRQVRHHLTLCHS